MHGMVTNTNSSSTELNALSLEVKRFCEERDWDQFHLPKDLAIGLVTESAELLDLFRFKSESQCREIISETGSREKVSDELADILFFVLRFAERTGISLSEALETKLEKNRKKYPVETSRGSNKKYNE